MSKPHLTSIVAKIRFAVLVPGRPNCKDRNNSKTDWKGHREISSLWVHSMHSKICKFCTVIFCRQIFSFLTFYSFTDACTTYLPIYLPTYLSIYLPTYLTIYLLTYLSIYLFIYLHIYLPIRLSGELLVVYFFCFNGIQNGLINFNCLRNNQHNRWSWEPRQALAVWPDLPKFCNFI